MATAKELSAGDRVNAGTVSAVRRRRWRRRMVPWFFILPAVLLHVCVVGGPALVTFVLSLTSWNGFTFGKFIGLANYYQVVTKHPTPVPAMRKNVKWTIIVLA